MAISRNSNVAGNSNTNRGDVRKENTMNEETARRALISANVDSRATAEFDLASSRNPRDLARLVRELTREFKTRQFETLVACERQELEIWVRRTRAPEGILASFDDRARDCRSLQQVQALADRLRKTAFPRRRNALRQQLVDEVEQAEQQRRVAQLEKAAARKARRHEVATQNLKRFFDGIAEVAERELFRQALVEEHVVLLIEVVEPLLSNEEDSAKSLILSCLVAGLREFAMDSRETLEQYILLQAASIEAANAATPTEVWFDLPAEDPAAKLRAESRAAMKAALLKEEFYRQAPTFHARPWHIAAAIRTGLAIEWAVAEVLSETTRGRKAIRRRPVFVI